MSKTILITGASRGIGHAVAHCFLSYGFQVFGTSTTQGSIDIVHERFIPLTLDFLDPKTLERSVVSLANQPIDILVNNAGILLENWSNPNINMEQLRKTFDVNLFGLIDLTERLLPNIQKNGHIVNISSGWGALDTEVDQFQPHYKLSKAALNMYTKILSDRLVDRGIVVSSFSPGWVQTDMGGASAPKLPEMVAEEVYALVAEANVSSGQFWESGAVRSW